MRRVPCGAVGLCPVSVRGVVEIVRETEELSINKALWGGFRRCRGNATALEKGAVFRRKWPSNGALLKPPRVPFRVPAFGSALIANQLQQDLSGREY